MPDPDPDICESVNCGGGFCVTGQMDGVGTQVCVCKEGFVLEAGTCTCPEGFVERDGTCVCPEGTVLRSGTCEGMSCVRYEGQSISNANGQISQTIFITY